MTEPELKLLFHLLGTADAAKPEQKAVLAELERLDQSTISCDDSPVLTFVAQQFFESQEPAIRLAAIKCIAAAPMDDFRVLPVLLTAAADENLQIRQVAAEALVRWELAKKTSERNTC